MTRGWSEIAWVCRTGGAFAIHLEYDGASCPANPGDFALASSHEDLARGNDRDLCLDREGAAAGVLQPKL